MAKKDSSAELQEAILVLQSKQQEDLKRLKKEFEDVKDRLKPKNLVKEGISKVRHSSGLKTGLIIAGAGIASIFAVKKIKARRRKSHNLKHQSYYGKKTSGPVNKASGQILKYVVTAIVSQNSDKIKSFAYRMLSRMKTKPKTTIHQNQPDNKTNPVK